LLLNPGKGWWAMPSPMAIVLSITLANLSMLIAVQAAAPDPRAGQIDHVISLSQALIRGVDQCFNPSNKKGNDAAKKRLNNLANTARSGKSSLIGGDAQKVAHTAAELEAQWKGFSAKAPLLARAHCATQRDCMRLGFEGNNKYRHCLPVNGDPHANIQYIQFEELVDSALPKLIAALRSRS
jgi:hypothetical protein